MNLFITGYITEKTLNRVLFEIITCPEEEEAIVVYINSHGGEGEYDYAIYEALRLSGKSIITYAAQDVYSAAITVFLAGDMRYAHNYSQFMIHEPYHDDNSEKTTVTTYKHALTELKKSTTAYYKLITDRCDLTTAKIQGYTKKALNGDWFFDTKTAKSLKLVTDIGLPIIPTTVEWEVSFSPEEKDECKDNKENKRKRR